MKPENKQFLEENRALWITLRDAQYLRFPHQGIKDRLVQIMREEFRPGYTADLWCSHCVGTMVREVYQAFEAWEAAQVTVTEEIEPTVLPTQIKANFPSHKKHHRR